MKKIFLTIVAAAALHTASAQNSAVVNAIMYQRQGVLDKARAEIDKAALNEKTSTKAKTWYTRGEIYEKLMTDPIFGKAIPQADATKLAYDSYKKAQEVEGKDNEFAKKADEKVKSLQEIMYGQALNAGVESYNGKNYAEALKSYRLAQQYRPQDTTAYLYAAYAAQAGNDFAAANESYKQLMAMNYKSPAMYSRMIQMAGDDEKAKTAVLQQALQAYPNNKDFMLMELNMYLKAGRGKEAIDKINKAIAVDPKNSNLYAVLGSVYDQNKQPNEALAAYKKAVEVDPKNFDAQYNAGVYYFNKAADIFKATNKMDLATYQKKGKAMEAEGKKLVEQSIPYFEAALQISPNDRGTLTALQKGYMQLGRKADSERMSAKMEGQKK
ncbi:tetratricopeptide repeat protein [Hymenobacter sp. BT175]|uniref:tetratricopeptide repeat protein n=1 Tax=Hymenobacter translucens TaxID=2886507 RepID=UPI001D0EEACE|nr:tetratricopeptide repeat protein [Hymenobacter translucens]MCC2544852.1 tetratricopeptide repeat protein [Hymenobacter translucens]